MDVTIKEIAEKLKEYDNYCIVYHIRPDGDCIGTAFGLCLALQSIGKKCTVKGQDEIPRIHRYMTDKVQLDEIADPVYIAVDSASRHRVGIFGDKHFTFCIDHHHNTFDNVDYRYVETDTGACAELIYKIIKEMGVTVTKQIANLLYTAIVTDTMCFRTTDTRVQTFEVATELAKAGADVYHIGRINTFIKSAGRMKIENILRDSFHFTYNNQIVTGIIMLKDLETAGVLDSDIEGINSLVEQIEGVRIGVTIRELPDGRMRCSMRSNGEISSNDICRIHGGGGHFHAACCELDMSAAEAREVMERTCREYLESKEHGRIYAFIGASACGKSTLCTILDKEYETVHKVVTDTTRSPRKGEVDKVHYNFVSEQFFRENIDSYVEYNEYDNHLYGSNGTRIADALDGGKADVVICLDINGAKALKKHYGEQIRVIYVHRDIEKIYAAIDERVANGEITAESAVHRKEQVMRDIESRNDPAIDFEVDNNGALVNTIAQIEEIMQRQHSEVDAKLFDILQNLSVINRDNGKRFTSTDRLEAISSILWDSKYRRINCDGLFNLYSAKPLEQLFDIELTVVSSHVDCEQNITKCFSSSIDEKMLCGTYDNSITNTSILYLMTKGALPDNVLVAFTGDEEENCTGAKHLIKYLNSKKMKIKTIVVLDVTDMGWDEKADFTVENNFWSENIGKRVIDIADQMHYMWRFVPENIDEIPEYIASDKVVFEEAEEDESWFYDEKNSAALAFVCR